MDIKQAEWEPTVGSRLGEYEILALLGRGGTSAVYRARKDGQIVALKVLRSEFRLDTTYRGRLEREGQVLQRHSHPNVLRFYDIGEDKGLLYVAMECVEGISLRQLLQMRGRLSAADALPMFECILAGMGAAHSQGITHRDLKPENILQTAAGEIKLTDFGCAKGPGLSTVTAEGVVFGTPTYMAPEHFQGQHSVFSDQYSAGVLLFEMLTGGVPFKETDPVQLALAHVGRKPPNPSSLVPEIPERVSLAVLKALAKTPKGRHADLAAFAAALRGE